MRGCEGRESLIVYVETVRVEARKFGVLTVPSSEETCRVQACSR
jgi:hypothetical protein